MQLDGVVFDVDGVLFDTQRLAREVWAEIGEKMGYPHMDEQYINFVGEDGAGTRRKMLELFGPDFPQKEFLKTCAQRNRARMAEEGVPLKPGVREILDFLKERGVPVALATATNREHTINRMDMAGLTSYFQEMITEEQVTRGKPDPEIYCLACQKLGVDPAETIAVEDSYHGVQSAAAAGMRVVMVPDLLPPTPELEKLLFKRFDALVELRDYLSEVL